MKRKIPISTLKSHKRPTKRSQGSVYSAVFHAFLPPRLFLHYCVLISFVASSVGLTWGQLGPFEYVWRSVSDLETSQRKRCQCPLPCPGYSCLQQFSWQPADKAVLRISTIRSVRPLTFQPLNFSSWFSHLSLLHSTSFKQTQKKKVLDTTSSESIHLLLPFSDPLDCVHGCVSVWACALQPELLS